MEPLIFQTLPGFYSFIAAVAFIQISVFLLVTGRRHFKKVSVAAVSLVGGVVGESIGIDILPVAPWVFIFVGLAGGAFLGYFLRPVGVGLVLAFLGYTISSSIITFEYVQLVAAMVLFAYGLLLTDLAPTFISSLLAASILLLSGEWAGASTPGIMVLAGAVAAARIMAAILPSRLAFRSHRPSL